MGQALEAFVESSDAMGRCSEVPNYLLLLGLIPFIAALVWARMIARRHYRHGRIHQRHRHMPSRSTQRLRTSTTPLMALPAVSNTVTPQPVSLPFDTDSFRIGVDSCASVCFTNTKADFVSPLVPCNARIRGIGGGVSGPGSRDSVLARH